MRKNLKLQLCPGSVASYDIQPGNGVGLFWDTKHTHIFTYLLTYLLSPDPQIMLRSESTLTYLTSLPERVVIRVDIETFVTHQCYKSVEC